MRTAGEGGLSPFFASRAAVPHPVTVDGSQWQFCNPPLRANPVAGPCRAHLPARWKEKVYTSNVERPRRGFRLRLLEKVNCGTAFRLASAIVPRRRGKDCSASIQSARQGKLRTEAGCGLRRVRLFLCFRLTSRSAASVGSRMVSGRRTRSVGSIAECSPRS